LHPLTTRCLLMRARKPHDRSGSSSLLRIESFRTKSSFHFEGCHELSWRATETKSLSVERAFRARSNGALLVSFEGKARENSPRFEVHPRSPGHRRSILAPSSFQVGWRKHPLVQRLYEMSSTTSVKGLWLGRQVLPRRVVRQVGTPVFVFV
jgi:hypothetical protein